MFLNYDYITTFKEGNFKLELYDTGKRWFLFFSKIYAYQLFHDNKLVAENHRCRSKEPHTSLRSALMIHSYMADPLEIGNPKIVYIEECKLIED